MIERKQLTAAVFGAAMALSGVAGAATLTIVGTDPTREEHTGDPGGSAYPWVNGASGPGAGVPWQSRDEGGGITGGWPTGAGMSADPSFQPNWGTSGWYGSYLRLDAPKDVTFQYMGQGDSALANSFQVDLGSGFFTVFDQNTAPCGASGAAAPVFPTCTAGVNEFTYQLAAGYVPFRFVTGNGVNLTNDGAGGNPTDITNSPGYFLGLDPYQTTGPHQTTGVAVYAGLTDLPAIGDHDFQDMGVRISTVPEPGTLALLGLTIGGFALRRRRQPASA